MTFPATPLDQTTELLIGGVWTNITSLVYGRDPVTVTRGRPDEASQVERSTLRATVNNRSGNLSPRNPTGSYYGLIGRNTPIRVRKSPASPKYLLLTGAFDSNASSTPPQTELGTDDTANVSITTDIDIRVDFQADAYGFQGAGLANKYLTAGDQRSWVFWINADRTLTFSWSPNGTAPSLLTKTSTAAVTIPSSGRVAVRVVLDANNGAAGNDVKFYTAATMAGPFVQLGATVTTAAVTSIFDSTTQLEIGRAHSTVSGGDLRGRVYAFQAYASINSTSLRVDVDIDRDAEAGDLSFTDGAGVLWTLDGDASIVDPAIRFSGEVSEWPQRWDSTGSDVYVPIEASGIMRRLDRPNAPLKSALYRGYTNATFTPKAYWPCEEPDGAGGIASALAGHPPMMLLANGGSPGLPNFASNSSFQCSSPLPTMSQIEWTGHVPTYTATGKAQVFLLMLVPEAGTTNGEGLFHVVTTGTVRRWTVLYGTGGTLELRAYDDTGTQLLATGAAAFTVNGKLLRVDLELQQNGGNIDYDLATLQVGASTGSVVSGTLAANTISRATDVVVNPGADLDDVVIGHISVHDEVRSLFDLSQELNAYAGEAAGRRVERLCSEESVTFRGIGDLDASVAMGGQLPSKLLDLLRECASTDGGILFEPRDLLGLGYRPRYELGAQPARLELDYTATHLGTESQPGIEPTDDDEHLRNDVIARRLDGGFRRAVQETGVLSVLDPPDGVGRYDDEITVNVQSDALLDDQAGWLLHLGTTDEARFPTVLLELARAPFVASATLARAVEDLDIGDRLTIDHPPAWLPPDLIDQLAEGFTEVLGGFTHTFTVNCSPGTPWTRVLVWEDTDDRYTSDGTVTTEPLDTTETGVDVSTPTGLKWSHTDGNFDVVIGGERMTVTAVTGAGIAQTLTVTRSVNGVVKTHLTGVEVELFRPGVYLP